MSLANLNNLAKTGQLKHEPFNQLEFDGLVRSGSARLRDAYNKTLSSESRFDLAYNASHSLSLAALRWHSFRCNNRYLVFQVLPYTLGIQPEVWRILAKCHERRNVAEYEGGIEIEDQLLSDLLSAAQKVFDQVKNLQMSVQSNNI